MRIGFPVIPWCSNIQPPVSSCQDQLAADMYNFFSKEGDYARYFVTVSTLCREKQTCFRGNVHSCGGSRGKKKTACVSHFIHFAIISFKCLSDWTLPSFPPLPLHIHFSLWFFVSAALRGSGGLPQKVSHCTGECFANRPGAAR